MTDDELNDIREREADGCATIGAYREDIQDLLVECAELRAEVEALTKQNARVIRMWGTLNAIRRSRTKERDKFMRKLRETECEVERLRPLPPSTGVCPDCGSVFVDAHPMGDGSVGVYYDHHPRCVQLLPAKALEEK